MKQKVFSALFAGIIILLAASCASTPAQSTGQISDISAARSAAEQAREQALEMKADVAVPAIFSEADSVYAGAKESDEGEAMEAALDGYNTSITLFTKAYDEAKAKKDAAMKALDTAEKERITSEDVLRQIEEEQNNPQEGGNE